MSLGWCRMTDLEVATNALVAKLRVNYRASRVYVDHAEEGQNSSWVELFCGSHELAMRVKQRDVLEYGLYLCWEDHLHKAPDELFTDPGILLARIDKLVKP